jgi:hypothetical protein
MAFWPLNIAVAKDHQKKILNNIETFLDFSQSFPTLFVVGIFPKTPKTQKTVYSSGNKPSSFGGFCLARGAERRGVGSAIVNNVTGRRKRKKKEA